MKHSWVMQVPVLTTGHISKDTNTALGNMVLFQADVPGVSICAEYAEGYFIYLGGDEDPGRMTEDIAAIRAWAAKHSYEWIRLDSVGDTVDGLPTYDW